MAGFTRPTGVVAPAGGRVGRWSGRVGRRNAARAVFPVLGARFGAVGFQLALIGAQLGVVRTLVERERRRTGGLAMRGAAQIRARQRIAGLIRGVVGGAVDDRLGGADAVAGSLDAPAGDGDA
jgi:hypothetical protein